LIPQQLEDDHRSDCFLDRFAQLLNPTGSSVTPRRCKRRTGSSAFSWDTAKIRTVHLACHGLTLYFDQGMADDIIAKFVAGLEFFGDTMLTALAFRGDASCKCGSKGWPTVLIRSTPFSQGFSKLLDDGWTP